MSSDDSFSIEKALYANGCKAVVGVDEAGRGPLAGPVVAGAVLLPPDTDYTVFKDSKKLSAKKREMLFGLMQEQDFIYGVGLCSSEEIDEINILQASLLAMKRAVQNMQCQPDYLLIDGKFKIAMELPQEALIKGEDRSASIAAASIVAKVIRYGLMREYDQQYPAYQFARHKGYPTKLHKALIAEHGICPIHRRTFKGVKEFSR
jgi:ribonuclease HII